MSVRQKQAKSSDIDFLGSIRSIGEKYRTVRVPTFAEYAQSTFSKPLDPWQIHLCNVLQRLIDEPGVKIAVHAPPGVGKSVLTSQRFPAYCIGRKPEIRVFTSCYNITKAEEHTSVTRDLIAGPEHREIFPDSSGWVETSAAAGWFQTPARRALNDGQPSVKAIGIKTGLTGSHPDILIVDDPYASAAESESQAINDATLRFFRESVMGRSFAETSLLVMFHRYHDSDVAASAIEEYDFDYHLYPAIIRSDPDVRFEAPVGSALTPRRDEKWCEEFQARPENRKVYRSQYLGIIDSVEGRLIDVDRFKFVPKLPEPCYVFCRGYDVGLTEEGDPSVGFLVGLGSETNTMYAIGYWTDRVLPSRLKAKIKELAEGDPGHTIVAVERSTASISVIDDLIQDPFYTHPRSLKQVTATRDKWSRASGWASRADEGRLVFVGDKDSAEWKAWITECRKFRNYQTDRDDKIDALTVAFEALKEYRDTSHLRETERIIPGTEAYYNALMDGQS